jgi:hypothetical protein
MDDNAAYNAIVRSAWVQFDPENTGTIQPDQIKAFLTALAEKQGKTEYSASWTEGTDFTEPLALDTLLIVQ